MCRPQFYSCCTNEQERGGGGEDFETSTVLCMGSFPLLSRTLNSTNEQERGGRRRRKDFRDFYGTMYTVFSSLLQTGILKVAVLQVGGGGMACVAHLLLRTFFSLSSFYRERDETLMG